jgi:hypothetical protein
MVESVDFSEVGVLQTFQCQAGAQLGWFGAIHIMAWSMGIQMVRALSHTMVNIRGIFMGYEGFTGIIKPSNGDIMVIMF